MSKLDRNIEINEKALEKPGFRLNPNSFLGKITRPFALAALFVIGGATTANCTFDTGGLKPPQNDARPVDDGSLDGGPDGGDAGNPDADASNPDADASNPDADASNPDADAAPDPEICDDGIDNDGDGDVDCADHADCDGQIGPGGITCASTEIGCDDGGDNDGDGDVDCFDSDCIGNSACPEICDDGIDNNGDGYTDCEAPECNGYENTLTKCGYGDEWEINCTNGIDDNGNGYTDCQDIACSVTATCGAVVEDCNSFSADVNNDLLTKCEDVTCFLHDDCIDWEHICPQSAGSLCGTGTSGQCGSGTCSEGHNFNNQSIPKTCNPLDQSCY